MKKKYTGISLIEVMTTIALITLMIAVGLAMVGRNKQDAQIEAASRELAAHLREAQNNALTGRHVDGKPACGFGVHRDEAVESRYQFFYGNIDKIVNCSKSTAFKVDNNFTSFGDSFDLPNSITVSNFGDTYFSSPFAQAFYDGSAISDSGKVQYVLTKNKGVSGKELSVYVCLTGKGEVTESKNPC